MASHRRVLFYLIPLLAGGLLAALWVRIAGGSGLASTLGQANPLALAGMLALTTGWLAARFIRWQFLLRRVGVRVPARPSLAAYLAALPGTATPAYVGEIARGVFIRRRFGVPLRMTTAVLVLERLYDVAALGLVAVVTASDGPGVRLGMLFVVVAVVAAIAAWPLGRRCGLHAEPLARLRALSTVGPAMALSVVAWMTAALLVGFGASALGVPLTDLTGANVFATSTLLGAVTLLPAGVGATGSAAILQLESLGVPLASGIAIISLVRLTSTGAALSVGAVFLWRELRRRQAAVVGERAAHFDEIADDYRAQWSTHVWDHLLARKIDLIASAIPPPKDAGVGLDLGCGLGVQLNELARRGYRVMGVDPSFGLLSARRPVTVPVLAGDARALPFHEASFDFVYAVGVLHHLPGREAQATAYREIARVLRPGGVLLIHETNPRNPLFRFYMGYVFPILKKIDEGTESWVEPDQSGSPPELRVETVHYFTFMPHFTPRALMRPTRMLERVLERGWAGRYAAHYMAVLRRAPDAPAPAGPAN